MDTSINNESSGYNKKPLWQWALIYLLIGGVVYAGIYYYFFAKGDYASQESMTYSSPAPVAMTAEGATEFKIAITDTGYSPSLLSINVGDTITWTNGAVKPSNVSSDPHPAHTDYVPLNLGMFNPGETQSLTFDKAGTYGYHNHLNPTQTGTVIVK